MGARRDEPDSERRCVATRLALPVEELLRFVAGPDGRLTPDIRRKLPGRGVWTALSREAVERAVRTRAFPRSLKSAVEVPDGLADEVDALLVRDALQSLSFANKAGLLVTGFGKVEAALSGARAPAIWIEAADGAEDGRRKLMQAMRRRHGDHSSAVPIADCFDSHDLGLALGRELVIHAALKDGAASGAFLDRWRRLVHFRTRPLPQAAMPAGADEFQKDVTAGPTSE
ncbi:MAG: RNA-binding protein [Bosea sp.]|jgi:predicted RNA-binding protein YlxR (DUF448 family)|nr:RNA-binding protein [Bosea sp. (in: a-proteobacteria)]